MATAAWRRGGAQGLLPTVAGGSSERGAMVCTVAAVGLGPDRGAGSERSAGVRGVSACCPERELRHAGACARGGAPREARGQGKEGGGRGLTGICRDGAAGVEEEDGDERRRGCRPAGRRQSGGGAPGGVPRRRRERQAASARRRGDGVGAPFSGASAPDPDPRGGGERDRGSGEKWADVGLGFAGVRGRPK